MQKKQDTKEKQDYFDEQVKRIQYQFYGKRYVGAVASRVAGRSSAGETVAEKAVEFCKKKQNFFVYSGPAGCGKNYLCAALVPWMLQNFATYRIYDEYTLLEKVRQSIAQYAYSDYTTSLKLLLDDELVIINDLGSCAVNEWREEVLFTALDMRYNSMKPTILTTNLSKEDFKEIYHSRVVSRIFAKDNIILELDEAIDWRQQ